MNAWSSYTKKLIVGAYKIQQHQKTIYTGMRGTYKKNESNSPYSYNFGVLLSIVKGDQRSLRLANMLLNKFLIIDYMIIKIQC